MKTNLGISIYPEIVGKEETVEYIKLAHKHEFTRIFANLLELEDNKEGREKLEMLSSVYKFAKDLGFEVIVDVNPNFYKAFKLEKTEIDFFHNLHVSGIRLDEDFGGEVESILTNNDKGLMIELNASATSATIDATLEKKGNPKNLIACHNFYPMRYTGLAYERFVELSAHFRAREVRVKAFITLPEEQKGIGPWNVNEGMPTIEKHRDMSIEEQVKDLLSTGLVNDIIISQQGATEEQFINMNEALKEVGALLSKTIELKIDYSGVGETEKDIVFKNKGKEHNNRPDYNGFFVRSTFPRIDYKNETIKPKKTGLKLNLGDVVVLNENLGRYKGELHIIVKPLDDYNNARNIVGKIIKEDLWKLKFIKGGKKFLLVKNG